RAGLEQVRGSANIVIVISERVDVRFANICIGSEVHNPPGFPGLEHATKNLFVSQVTAFKRPPLNCALVASFEIVRRYWAISSSRQRLARMATDKACTAGYKDRSHCSSRIRRAKCSLCDVRSPKLLTGTRT